MWRFDLSIDKFTGEPQIAYIVGEGPGGSVWLNDREVAAGTSLDFPFFTLAQVPIGNVPEGPANYGLLTFKDRETGVLYVLSVGSAGFGEATVLPAITDAVGGASTAIRGDLVLVRVDMLAGGKVLRPYLLRSSNQGTTFTEPSSCWPDSYDDHALVPGSGGPVTDHFGNFHMPLVLSASGRSKVFNLVDDVALVEAMPELGGPPDVVLAAFPKKPAELTARFGDHRVDGLGLIMVAASDGRLFTSNSESGGISFPAAANLNREMPLVAGYAATECYTSGRIPNYVSMDYLYIEGDDAALPMSPRLHLETWDMPLAEPQISATARGDEIEVLIESAANFEVGKTLFELDDPSLTILDVRWDSQRIATLKVDRDDGLAGARVSFEMRSLFYHHAGNTTIA